MNTRGTKLLPAAVVSGVLAALSAPLEALAWGPTGHEAVAYVAWQQMTPTARTEALALIKMVPRLTSPRHNKVDGYDQWVKELPPGLSADDQKLYLFMRAATWPDTIKHVGFKDSDVPPAGVAVDRPIGFKDKASHGYWHFIDKGMTSDGSTVPATPTPNVAAEISELRKDLAAGSDVKLKAYEVVWLEHLVGDIHQPLHGVRRFVANKSDQGGNFVKITLPDDLSAKFLASKPAGAPGSAPDELHAFWDDLPGVTSDPARALKPAADFAQALPAANGAVVKDSDPQHWADESFAIAQQDGYVSPPIGPKNGPAAGGGFPMTEAYYDRALGDAKTRIALAGARLANMLNDTWPAAPTN